MNEIENVCSAYFSSVSAIHIFIQILHTHPHTNRHTPTHKLQQRWRGKMEYFHGVWLFYVQNDYNSH